MQARIAAIDMKGLEEAEDAMVVLGSPASRITEKTYRSG